MIFWVLLSSFLRVLSLKPFDWWLLVFITLVPYFYVLNRKNNYSKKTVFFIGFVMAVNIGFFTSFIILYRYLWIWLPAVILYGVIIGFATVFYYKLRRGSVIDVFIFASIWALVDFINQIVFQNFDYTLIAYSAHKIIPLMSFASIGGVYLVTFIIIVINGFIGYALIKKPDKKYFKTVAIFLLLLGAIYFANQIYLNSSKTSGNYVDFAVIQTQRWDPYYGVVNKNNLEVSDNIEKLVDEAVASGSKYIIFPYNLVKEISVPADKKFKESYIDATFEQLGSWLKKKIPAGQIFVMWPDTMREQGKVFDEINFWEDGKIIDYYQKRVLFPFHDYAVSYSKQSGIITRAYDFYHSNENRIINIGDERISNLTCSELNQSFLARRDAKNANVILSIGFSSVFGDNFLGEKNIIMSQFRAAETGLPVIRGDIWGQSSFVDKSGAVVESTEPKIGKVLKIKAYIEQSPVKTIYTKVGDWLLMGFILLFLYSLSNFKFNIFSRKNMIKKDF